MKFMKNGKFRYMHNLIHNHKLHNAVCDGFVRMSVDLNEQRLTASKLICCPNIQLDSR